MTQSLMESIGSAIHRFFERHRIEKTRTELLSLDDHALADIGLTRNELEFREDPLLAHAEMPERNEEADWMRRTH